MEVNQQAPYKMLKRSSFCGPDLKKHTNLDCISVSHQTMQELCNRGKKLYLTLRYLKNLSSSITCILQPSFIQANLWQDCVFAKRQMNLFNLSLAMHWWQTSECVACIHLVALSRSYSEVRIEKDCSFATTIYFKHITIWNELHFFHTILFVWWKPTPFLAMVLCRLS